MDLISILSEIRSQYNCFDPKEEPYYHALSEAIKALSADPEPSQVARDIATIIENEQDMRVIAKEREVKLDEWCETCKEYDQERHCCPRWNRVIRNTVEELKAEPWKGEEDEPDK